MGFDTILAHKTHASAARMFTINRTKESIEEGGRARGRTVQPVCASCVLFSIVQESKTQ